jgi:eukaryotic-like serine/threonine-protein kinase
MEPGRVYRFAGITIDLGTMRMSRDGEEIALEPRLFYLLEFLILNRERVLTKEEIFQTIWKDVSVTDNALTRAIVQIRRALNDDPKNPKFIETVPTIGYRFIGKLVEEDPAPRETVAHHGKPRIIVWASGLAILAGIAIAAWLFRARPAQLTGSAPIPLTSYRGSADAASFSPDGALVAFQWDGEKQHNVDIYVKALGPDAFPMRLTTDPAPDRWPSWSPDGRTIAFQRMIAPGRVELRTIPALGGPERKLAEFPIDNLGSTSTWSPDSKWLVVPAFIDGQWALFRVSAGSGGWARITHPETGLDDLSPAVSPSGNRLLFVRRASYYYWGTLYTLPIDADMQPVGTLQAVPSGGVEVGDALWTADGKDILVSTADGFFRMPAGGAAHLQAVPFLGPDVKNVAISGQGAKLIYTTTRGDANVWRIDLSSPAPVPEQFIASTFRDVAPRYSPDGHRIAFQSNRTQSNRSIGSSQVWVEGADGSQPEQLTSMAMGNAGTPRWSPDGQTIAFDSNASGRYQIYLVSTAGGAVAQRTNGNFKNFTCAWSRDGRWIYFSSDRSGQSDIWKMPSAGGTPRQVTHHQGQFPVESEDGATLYFAKTMGSGSIWSMPADGGPEVQLADSLYRGNFAVAKTGIYYMTSPGPDGTSSLLFHKFTTGETTILLNIGHPEFGLDVSPDGRYLLYAQFDDPGSDLMLIENFR